MSSEWETCTTMLAVTDMAEIPSAPVFWKKQKTDMNA